MDYKQVIDQLTSEILTYVQKAITKSATDRSFRSQILEVLGNGKYKVRYKGKEYTAKSSSYLDVGTWVTVCALQNNWNELYIIDGSGSNGDTTQATDLEREKWNKSYEHSVSAHAPANAQANVIETVKVNGTVIAPSKNTIDIAVPTKTSDLVFDNIEEGANNYKHPTSGVKAGTYKSVTVDVQGHITNGTNPTTLSGYGITDGEAKGTAASLVSSHNSSNSAHNDIRELINGLTNRLNTLADSDDTTLDQMSEIVAYIKANKSLIESITTSKINVSDIVNNLTTNASNKPLSAAQGVVLKGLVDALQTEINKLGSAAYTESSDYSKANHTHKYAGAETTGGAAVSANKLNSDAGSATKPVYFSGGIPKVCSYELNKTVPADAKFTDTVYSHPNSGAVAGTYKSVTVNAQGHVTGGSNPTTLAGYGITDAESKGTATSTVNTHNVSTAAHNDIRKLISDLTSRLNALANSDDETLDQMAEVVAYIKANRSLIESVTTSKVNVSDIINNLTTNTSNKPLSAAQGVVLKTLIDTLQAEMNKLGSAAYTDSSSYAAASHTHKYAGSSTVGGSANSAEKLSSNAGATNKPIYFADGVPKACAYELNKTVPADAKFTDTTYDLNEMINDLSIGNSTPVDADYYISQWVNGGTSTVTYHRRPMSALWAYIKQKADNIYATSGHTHSYLPLSGGTVTGATIFSNMTASTSKTTGTVKVSGGLGVAGQVSADKMMIGDACTLSYDSTNECINFIFN